MPCIVTALCSRHNGHKLGAREFPLHLLRVEELMARRVTRIEPRHDRLRSRRSTVCKSERSVAGSLLTHGGNRKKRRIQLCTIGVENIDYIMLGEVFWQHEHVGSRRQDASGNLNGLAESDSGGLIRLVCACSRLGDQKCK